MTQSHELILGGQKSGKSRRAEQCAAGWLAAQPGRQARLLATARAGDAEMAARIARHQADRAARVPGLATHEVGADLAAAVALHSRPGTLLVVDCLTLWLTGLLMPLHGAAASLDQAEAAGQALVQAVAQAPAPVVLVSNEIGLGVTPLGAETRRFLDALGLLHQRVALVCPRVTLMVAGCALAVKQESAG